MKECTKQSKVCKFIVSYTLFTAIACVVLMLVLLYKTSVNTERIILLLEEPIEITIEE